MSEAIGSTSQSVTQLLRSFSRRLIPGQSLTSRPTEKTQLGGRGELLQRGPQWIPGRRIFSRNFWPEIDLLKSIYFKKFMIFNAMRPGMGI